MGPAPCWAHPGASHAAQRHTLLHTAVFIAPLHCPTRPWRWRDAGVKCFLLEMLAKALKYSHHPFLSILWGNSRAELRINCSKHEFSLSLSKPDLYGFSLNWAQKIRAESTSNMAWKCKLMIRKQKSRVNLSVVSELSQTTMHRWMAAHPASAWNGDKKEDAYPIAMALLATAFRLEDGGCVLAASLKANLQRKNPKSSV